MKMKKLSATDRVDLFEEKIFSENHITLSDEARDQIFWLYENEIEFTFSVDKHRNMELKLTHEEDVMGFKLRWD